ncbi:preprotein translocase subunit YajC [Georgenia satyanarayanai]|uniref:Preprotein translocase subunit YajC n=1 Tax=Georgenia satyanarayanai TaxID=860221 RepID=A0A2Y8ZY23_9MICO|nr:preprotein translocase subunit YajC [Georgenia satyanarayanai]PYG02084.1 preprotein translocase subunit YajC [Georgenia satyanarayanai]SSA36895.1 preprotein translocase subunit YajC [Georgenia satyanarayanai]
MEFLILIAVFGLMMWMMSRGAKKQRQAAAEVRNSLEVGQQVMTASGFYGTIVDVDGDVITLESTPGVETMWKREAIHSVTEPPFAVVDEEETAADDDTTVAVPDDASSLTTTDEPVVTDERPGDESDERRA